jgi:integrase
MSKRGNGEGSIYQLGDGRWRAAVSVGFKNGKPVRKTFTAVTRGAVQASLAKAVRDKQLGIMATDERTTFGAHLAAWLKDVVKPSVRPKTYCTYEVLVRRHVGPGLGGRPIAKLTPSSIRAFLNEKLESGLSAATVKHLLVLIRSSIGSAVKDGLVPRNVAAVVKSPTRAAGQVEAPKTRQPVSFDPAQARAFLDALQGDRLEALFTVAVSLGLRQGEILGLSWSDIDLEDAKLNVRVQLQRLEGKLVKVEPKSAKSVRCISLPAVAVSALWAHQAQQEKERQWAGSDWQDTGFVFTTSRGTPMDCRNVNRRFAIVLAAANLPKIRFHDLRHSAATLLLAQGVSPRYISDMLGHAQVSFTMQTYAHVLPHVQREVATKMDEILSRVATPVANKAVLEKIN